MRSKQFISFSLLVIITFFSCKKVDIQYGQQFSDNDYTQIVKIDTFSANLSTVYVDSFVTSAKGITLLGGYNDNIFGRMDTKCFFEVAPPTYQEVYDSTKLDSLTLILKLNKTYYGDTTSSLHINVNRLSQKILLPETQGAFYNNESFSVFPNTIGTRDIVVLPNHTDSITIRLSNDLGNELLSKLKNRGDLDMQNTSNFIEYFNGLSLSSNASSNLILSCTDNIIMRLSYNKLGIDSVEKYHTDFTMANSQHHFNNISIDRSKLTNGLQSLSTSNKEIQSSTLNNQAYCQYASGVMTKITFPSLNDLLKAPNFVKVLSARLIVRPVKGTFNTYYTLPSSLRLATTDLNNGIGSDLAAAGTYTSQTGNLFIDYALGDNTEYTYDLTSYLKQFIKNPIGNNNGLLLLPPSPQLQTQFQRLVAGNRFHPLSKTILEIYYVTVH